MTRRVCMGNGAVCGLRCAPGAAALVLIIAAAAPAAAQQGGPPAMPVEVVPVRSEALRVEIDAVGTLAANEAVTLRPEISGRIAGVRFAEGAAVRAGEVLVTLDDVEYRAELAESTAALQLQELTAARAKRLFDQKFASAQDYDLEAARLAQAQARRALAAERLRKTALRAPFSGVAGLRHVSPGAYVQAGQDIVELQDLAAMKVDFQVPEVYLARITPELALSVTVDTFPGERFAGHVYAVAPALDARSRSIEVRGRIENPAGRLRPGLFARVKLLVAERPAALMIPEEALWPIGSEQFVYRVVEGRAALTRITTGERRVGEVEVIEGLSAGERVVTGGQLKIRDGAPVTVVNPPPSAAD